ncbi:replication initiation factor domain-containing protein [Luteibacter sp. 22Crub2.1]|uniref:replication initiation factor domain-containing protein n=1 Tax=Luteibacter sp. 22Crub2.1 TaxID=1283288 RepID=UPI0009A6D0F7|nr:replication initiation factor domain-containing protein [Luteibacter sp. 22Crub2.1]SKB73815.1 phage replication initiation protein [Luteibacter sp. 22Crub2.1]
MIRRGLPEAFEPNDYHRVVSAKRFDVRVLCGRAAALPVVVLRSTPVQGIPSSPIVDYVSWADFVAVEAAHKAEPCPEGPISNTGLTGSLEGATGDPAFQVSHDYLTLVFPEETAGQAGQNGKTVVGFLFPGSGFKVSSLAAKPWQFYRRSAYITDAEGNMMGRLGVGGNGDTWCVSLTGAGCRIVKDWPKVKQRAEALYAHISRVDVAFDDFRGSVFDIHQINELARSGAFAGQGKPPSTRFIDDHGSNKGCTVYVGGKGRKELCAYEKGKQLGDTESPWVRIELRLWANNGVIPLDVLLFPERFLRGAYAILDTRLPVVQHAEAARPEYTRREVDATVEGAKRFLKQQCGPLLHLMWAALGPSAEDWFKENVFRNSMPGRFKGKGGDRESLLTLLREETGHAFVAPF